MFADPNQAQWGFRFMGKVAVEIENRIVCFPGVYIE